MIREVGLEPLFSSFILGKTLQYLCSDDVSLTERQIVRKNINFSALLSNETPGQPVEINPVIV